MLKPVIIVNGKMVGVWKQIKKKDRISISVEPFRNLSDSENLAIIRAAQAYGRYHEYRR